MKRSSIATGDAAFLGKALQALLGTAFSPDNFGPFLEKTLRIMAESPFIGPGAKLAITLRTGRVEGAFRKFCAKDRERLLAGLKPAAPGRQISETVRLGNAKAGSMTVLFPRAPENVLAARALLGMAAQFVSARLQAEKRDEELAFERDLASSLKHIEELYLAFPDISIEEISRAVLDEARRMTGSEFGFTGHIDAATGWLMSSALTTETYDKCQMMKKPVVFKDFSGLWGWVLKRKKTLLTNNAASDRRAGGLPKGHVKIEKFLGVPAMSGRRLLGILALANPAGDYSARDLDTAQKLARAYAIILQRKLSDDARREEDTRFKTIVSSTKDTIYTADLRGRVTYVSPRVEDFGYTPEEVIGLSVTGLVHTDDKEFIEKAWANALNTGRTLPILPYRIRRKNGDYAYVEQKSGIVFRDGRPLYITGVIRDVTEQKQTELLLKESETMMRMVFDTAADAIFIKDMNGMYVKANKACADLMGTTPEAMIGRSDSDYFPAEAAEAVFRTDSEVVRSGRTLSLYNHHHFPGGSRHVNIIKTPLRNVRGETIGLLGIARDITDLKRMEAELALARAAEAMSNVARPMAHDFNNALAAINGYATLIADGLDKNSPIKTEISRIVEAVKRAAELTSKFQDFARNPKLDGRGHGNP
jgi:PAS domain S-box-containing protein